MKPITKKTYNDVVSKRENEYRHWRLVMLIEVLALVIVSILYATDVITNGDCFLIFPIVFVITGLFNPYGGGGSTDSRTHIKRNLFGFPIK